MPMFNADKKLKNGKIKESEIPYMQRRNGKWDQSDVKGAKKKKWNSFDKQYEEGGEKENQSVSIFGTGKGLDWGGNRARTGPKQLKKVEEKPKKKWGFF